MKKWGKGEFWGASAEYDPEWLLTERQKQLRDKLIELCRVKIRPHAVSTELSVENFLIGRRWTEENVPCLFRMPVWFDNIKLCDPVKTIGEAYYPMTAVIWDSGEPLFQEPFNSDLTTLSLYK